MLRGAQLFEMKLKSITGGSQEAKLTGKLNALWTATSGSAYQLHVLGGPFVEMEGGWG